MNLYDKIPRLPLSLPFHYDFGFLVSTTFIIITAALTNDINNIKQQQKREFQQTALQNDTRLLVRQTRYNATYNSETNTV